MCPDNQNILPDSDKLSLDQLSQELQTSILQTLGCPVIGLALDGEYAGSGVLVEIDGVSGIVTAEHVIFNRGMPFAKAQGLYTIPRFYSADRVNDRTTHFSGTNVRIDLLSWYPEAPHRKNYKVRDAQWGPDLAFIRLPTARRTAFETTLRAVRINFNSLARDPEMRMRKALDENQTLLAIVGAPGETIKDVSVSQVHKSFIMECRIFLAAGYDYQVKENGYDYFDVPVDRESGLLLPKSFGGLSGGAVWRFRNLFGQNQSVHELQPDDYVLAGIAFWQDPENPEPQFIRAHGPRSLYEKFLPKLRAWLKTPGVKQDLPTSAS